MEKSGHYDYFKNNMFFLEEEKFALKPMNCPAHMVLFDALRVDKKQLPLRIADFGKLFRNENSGSLHGLARVKSFSQDDAHIFLAPEQLEEELNNLLQMVQEIYSYFGFKKYKINLSRRPEKRAGSDSQWDSAEAILQKVLSKVEYIDNPGEGAFYGPKIDFEVADNQGRYFQLGSIQLDFQLPERFDLHYLENNIKHRPIVIHRALLGSLERFIAIWLEHNQGHFPLYFSKVQAQVLVLNPSQDISAYKKLFKELGIRVEYKQVENIKQSLKEYYASKVPYVFILGNKEIAEGKIMVQNFNFKNSLSLEDFKGFWHALE